MSILDKKHILTIDLDDSSIEYSKKIFFYNTDKNISNLYVKIKKNNDDGVGVELSANDLKDITVKLTAIKPKTNQTREMTGILTEELTDQSCAIYKFELLQEFTDQVGLVVCEFELSNASGEKVTIDAFSYRIKESKLTGLNAEIESNPDLPVLKQLIKEVKETAQTVNNIDNTNVSDIKTYSNKKIEEKFSTVSTQIKEKANKDALDIERDRINQLTTLKEGSTTGDAELMDIRVGLNGEDFYNAGEAIRYQLSQICNGRITTGINLFNKSTVVKGKYLNSTGEVIDSTEGFVGTFIKIEEGTYRAIYSDKIVGYNGNKEFVNVCVVGTGNFTIDNTISYIKVSGSISNLEKIMVYSGTATGLTYEDYKIYFEADTSKKAYSLPNNSLEASYFKDDTINEKKCTFIEKSKNLFDKSKVTSGYYVNAGDGSLIANANFCVSDYIEVLPNTQYTIRYKNYFSEFTDKNSKGYDGGVAYSDNTNAESLTFTTKSTTKYIRFSSHISQLETNQLELGNSFTTFEPYKCKIKDELIPNNTLTTTTKSIKNIISRIFDKSIHTNIKLVGDSITHGQGGTGFVQDGEVIGTFFGNEYKRNTSGHCWANSFKSYLEEKFNCTVVNNAVAGTSTVELVNNFNTLVSDTDDIVICMYGTNNRINTYGKESFEPNLQTIIDNCKSKDIDLILMANIPCSVAQEENKTETNFHMEDVNHSVAKICANNNMEYVNVYQKFIDYCWYKDIAIDSLLADGLHPNDNGYDVMFKIICGELGIAIKRDGATW